MFLIMHCMHMAFHIHPKCIPCIQYIPCIQSYCAGMRTNTWRTFQGSAKCIPPFLLMSVEIFTHRGILTESSLQPDYMQMSHERWVFKFVFQCSLISSLSFCIKIKCLLQSFSDFTFTKQVPSFGLTFWSRGQDRGAVFEGRKGGSWSRFRHKF